MVVGAEGRRQGGGFDLDVVGFVRVSRPRPLALGTLTIGHRLSCKWYVPIALLGRHRKDGDIRVLGKL